MNANVNDDSGVMQAAFEAWNACAPLRAARRRFKDFTYGRQWGDVVTTLSGHVMTEEEYARASGRIPLTNNLIRQLVKSVVGRFRHIAGEGAGGDSAELARLRSDNMLDEMDARMLEEFLISGCAIQRIVREKRQAGGREASLWVDNVSPGRFFVNRFTDPRGWDIEIAGMLHDMSLTEVMMRYAHGDPSRRASIARAYRDVEVSAGAMGAVGVDMAESFLTAPPGRCRVIEVWTLESRDVIRCHDTASGRYFLTGADQQAPIDSINGRRREAGEPELATRRETTLVWRFRFFAPDGILLDSGVSPYRHGSHPFAIKFFPMTDGEVHSFVEDVIDQQRHVNRLITLIDHIMSHKAKGVLLFPASMKIRDMKWEEVADQWSRANGVIPYLPNSDHRPSQVVSNSSDAGAHELLAIEMKLLEQISGVSGALRGEAPGGNGGSALYESQIENSSIALKDIFESFNSFRAERDRKLSGELTV